MEEFPIRDKVNESADIAFVTQKLSGVEILEQLEDIDVPTSECVDTRFNEENPSMSRSEFDRLGFRVDQQEQEDSKAMEMIGDFFGELPEHLMDNILARVPVLTILCLRSVCKRWNALTSNSVFLENYSRPESRRATESPVFLLYADQARLSYPIYDPASNAWHLLPQTLNSSPPGNLSPSSIVVLAAAGGLLCLTDTLSEPAAGTLHLYVSNPITRAWRRLPPTIWMPLSKPYVVGMVVDSIKNTYKIVVARNGDDLQLQVYDSARNSWQIAGSVLRRLALIVGTAYTQGVLYCLEFGTGTSVSAYHIDRGLLEDVRAPMPHYLAWPQLFVSRGHLMMVGAIAHWGIMRIICVWQLDSLQMEWVEVLRVPDDLLSGLSRQGDAGAHNLFVADGDYVCFVSNQVKKMLMCNIFKKSWWWLPVCPFDTGDDAPNLSGFPLQPSLVASV
ncbi:unnamed protein product [Calypogeia fissa]